MNTNARAKAHFEAAQVACLARDFSRGVDLFRLAIEADPTNVALANGAAGFLMSIKQIEPARAIMEQTVARFPHNGRSVMNLGTLLALLDRREEAVDAWRNSLKLDPTLVSAELRLAKCAINDGFAQEAAQRCRRVIELDPSNQPAISLMLFAGLFDEQLSREQITQRTIGWDDRFAPPSEVNRTHANDRSPDRTLRIGYLSPFLRGHVNTYLFEPILLQHDRSRFELYAYCTASPARSDQVQLGPLFHRWRVREGKNHDEFANMIHADGIDVLVDLCSHMDEGSPATIARKPAPVQINYLAYPATSGLRAIDYRISCPALDPPGTEDALAPDKVLRLPHTFWCYPTDLAPAVEDSNLPSQRNGFVTFGCLNSFLKVRPPCVETWVRLLKAVPNSRLMLLAARDEQLAAVMNVCKQFGVDSSRIVPVQHASRDEHLSRFNQIDISVDPFPIGGHTTTHDSLWMGVPVIAMRGSSAMSRAGECILSHVGLPDLVAESPERYIEIAQHLAADLDRRAALRKSLRQTMRASALTDSQRFTRNLEAACRVAWKRWCANLPPVHLDVAGAVVD